MKFMGTRITAVFGLIFVAFVIWVLQTGVGEGAHEPAEEVLRSNQPQQPEAPLVDRKTGQKQQQLSSVELQRQTAASQVSALNIFDWRGQQVQRGDIYFCTDSVAAHIAIVQGQVRAPNFAWKSALVVIANHAPYFVARESLAAQGETYVVQMPEPTFWAEVVAEDHALSEIKLVVDYPWVNSAAWPRVLQEKFEIPTELPLQIRRQDRTVFFVGAPGESTTLSVHKQLLMETPVGLKRSFQFPPQASQQQLILHDFPVLTVRTVPGVGYEQERLCKMTVTLEEIGLGNFGIYREVDSDGTWLVPYDPTYGSATILVHDQQSGLQVGRSKFELTGVDQQEDVVITQEIGAITVLDTVGNGIRGAVIVQAGKTVGVTNSEGLAQVSLSKDAGKVWFLSQPHDALSLSPARLLADPIVYMQAATGVVIKLQSQDLTRTLDTPLLYEINNLPFSSVMWEAPGQSGKVYGLNVIWAEASGMEIDGMVEIMNSSYMFELEPSSEQERIIRIAGVFQTTREAQSQFVLYDAHQLEIWQDTVTVFPNTLSHRSLFLEDLLQTVSIQVVDASGTSISGAHIATGNDGFMDAENRTDAEGRASLVVSKKATFHVHVARDGYVSKSLAWPFATANVIRLEAGRQLRLQVLDSSGARVGVGVTLTDGTTEWYGNSTVEGVFQFTTIPKRGLRARITTGAAVVEYEVPAQVETFTLTHSL